MHEERNQQPDLSLPPQGPEGDKATPVATEETFAPSAGFAGFWVRAVAFMVDTVIVTVVQSALCFLLAFAAVWMGGGLDFAEQEPLLFILWTFGAILGAFYQVFFTGYCGQTPGKMAVRVKVVRTDGSDIGYGRAFVREIPGKFLSGILFGAGYLMVAFDPKRQGLHDKIADTCVVKL